MPMALSLHLQRTCDIENDESFSILNNKMNAHLLLLYSQICQNTLPEVYFQ